MSTVFILSKFAGRQCHEHLNKATCEAECRVHLIHSLCHCIPFSTAIGFKRQLRSWLKTYGSSICTYGHYRKCHLKYEGYEDDKCRTKCLNSCDLWTFAVFPKKTQDYDTWSEVTINFLYSSLVYPEFREYLPYTSEKMTSDLGGTIGLWMGASFLSIIHVIVFCVKRCKRQCTRENAKAKMKELPSKVRISIAKAKNFSLKRSEPASVEAKSVRMTV